MRSSLCSRKFLNPVLPLLGAQSSVKNSRKASLRAQKFCSSLLWVRLPVLSSPLCQELSLRLEALSSFPKQIGRILKARLMKMAFLFIAGMDLAPHISVQRNGCVSNFYRFQLGNSTLDCYNVSVEFLIAYSLVVCSSQNSFKHNFCWLFFSLCSICYYYFLLENFPQAYVDNVSLTFF